MDFGIAFAPLVPVEVLWPALAAVVALSGLLLFIRSRGAPVRILAMALLTVALANPSFTREDRQPLSSVAVVILDKSPSQGFGDRLAQTEAVHAALAQRLARIPGLETRFVEAGEAGGETEGTRLFAALGAALADVPPDRVAGAILVDGTDVRSFPVEASKTWNFLPCSRAVYITARAVPYSAVARPPALQCVRMPFPG